MGEKQRVRIKKVRKRNEKGKMKAKEGRWWRISISTFKVEMPYPCSYMRSCTYYAKSHTIWWTKIFSPPN